MLFAAPDVPERDVDVGAMLFAAAFDSSTMVWILVKPADTRERADVNELFCIRAVLCSA